MLVVICTANFLLQFMISCNCIFKHMKNKNLVEMFGDPIGHYAGEPAVGVRNEIDSCAECGLMPVEVDSMGSCGCGSHEESSSEICGACGLPVAQCSCQDSNICPMCGMMNLQPTGGCSCNEVNEAKKKKGPSKKTAQKILKGTKSFAQKMKKVSGWAEDPAAAAAWMMHKATGKWPSEK
jgi:hypothetical protein